MPIEWFTDMPKPIDDIKLNKGSITITEAGITKLNEIDPAFADAPAVRLGWIREDNTILIAPANAGEKATFKLGKRGRSVTSRTINAAPFYERFGIALPGESPLSSSIERGEGGAAAIKLPTGGANGTGKKRGRRKKSEIESA